MNQRSALLRSDPPGWPQKKWCLMACAERDRKAGRRQCTIPATYVVNLEKSAIGLSMQTFACEKCAESFASEDKITLEVFS